MNMTRADHAGPPAGHSVQQVLGAVAAATISGVAGRVVLVDGHHAKHLMRAAPGWDLAFSGTEAAPRLEARATGRLAEPLHVIVVTTGATASCKPALVITTSEGAEATLVETHLGIASSPISIEAGTQVQAGPSSILRHVRIQRQGIHATHAGRTVTTLSRAARTESFTFALGAQHAREYLEFRMAEGSEASVDGLFLGTGSQRLEHETRVHHDEPHATSRQLWKGILDGAAHGGFLGYVEVAKDAAKTNAEQTNRNLLLSDKATVDTTPQLEIHNDDVKCSHGSTIGRLDEDAIFFLRSRGLGPAQARQLLTHAFAREALARVTHEGIRMHLDGLVTAWFAGRHDTERVM